MMIKIIAIILAAGASTRMESPKALLKFSDGDTLLTRQVELLKQAQISDIIIVIGSDADKIMTAHPGLKTNFVINSNWQQGQFSSLKTGLEAALKASANLALILPIDTAVFKLETISKLSESLDKNSDANAIIPTFGGKQGHPILITQNFMKSLVEKDSQTSRLDEEIKKAGHIVNVAVDDPGITSNINTKKDWEKIN